MLLFAAFSESDFPVWISVVAIVAISLLFVGFFFWLIFRQAAKSRQCTHLERMKALEMGQPIEPVEMVDPQSKYLHNAFWISFWLGAGVPITVASGANSMMVHTNLQEFRLVLAIWICVAVISAVSVVCATVLMFRCRFPKEQNRQSATAPEAQPRRD